MRTLGLETSWESEPTEEELRETKANHGPFQGAQGVLGERQGLGEHGKQMDIGTIRGSKLVSCGSLNEDQASNFGSIA